MAVFLTVVGLGFLAYLIICIVLSLVLSKHVIFKRPYTYEEAVEHEKQKGEGKITPKSFPESYLEFELPSRNRKKPYNIYGRYFLQKEKTSKTAVIMHGHAGNLVWSYKYAEMFQGMGYNWFVFDNRGCGKSGGKGYSMGGIEKFDLDLVVDFARLVVEDAKIVVHGESLGASTAILSMEMWKEEKVSAVIADCGFSKLSEEMKFHVRKEKLPWYFVGNFGSLYTKIKMGYFYFEISPRKVLRELEVGAPLLLVHGKQDKKTPWQMSKEMYEYYNGKKEIYLLEGAGHAKVFWEDRRKYQEICENFIRKHIKD